MTAEIKIDHYISKEQKYASLLPQIYQLISDERNLITNLANITSALKYSLDDFLWVGFYITDKDNKDELVLGPFQGRVACTRIPFGKGACGAAAAKREVIMVADVNEFPGHIVCDALSRSEIVLPVVKDDRVIAVLDIDSDKLSNFDDTDKRFLEELVKNIVHIF